MALGKQAKTLSKGQVDALLCLIARTRHPIRNRVIVLLSVRAGLRAKEIASLTWDMVTNSEGTIGRPSTSRTGPRRGSLAGSFP